jgi:hypothetical protein
MNNTSTQKTRPNYAPEAAKVRFGWCLITKVIIRRAGQR